MNGQHGADGTTAGQAGWILERVADAHVTLDREFRITYVNAAAEVVLGKARDTMLGRTHWEVFPASVDTDAGRAYRRVVAEGVEQHLTQHYVGEGYDRHLEIDAYPTEEGGVAVFWRDVTARVAAETALREREARFEAQARQLAAITENATLALFVMDAHQRCTYMNPAAERLTGFALDELQGKPLHDYIHHTRPDGSPYPLAECPIDQALPQNMREQGTEVFVHQDGTFYEVAFTASPIREDGRTVGTVIEVRDVRGERARERERERLLTAERAARAEAEVARAAAEAERLRTVALQGVTAALAEARTLNDVAAVVVGAMAGAAGARAGSLAVPTPAGDALRLVQTFGFPEGVLAAIRVQPLDLASPIPEAFRTGTAIWATRRDGPDGMDARFPAVAHAWAVTDVASGAYLPLQVAGQTAGVIAYAFPEPRAFTDAERAFLLALARQVAVAVERARLFEAERVARAAAETAQAQAEAARRAAEEANQAKTAFLSAMSHELRTPLNAIGGYAELLALGVRGPVTDAQRADLERLLRANQHMGGLVTAVLDFARIEAGQVEFHLETVRLGPVLRDVEALVGPQLAAKGLAYDHDGCGPETPEQPHVVQADPEKLRQILLNLLTNAVKFTEAPGRVTLVCADDAAAGVAAGMIRIRVTDTGRGIPADQLERVFDPFVQVDRHRTHVSQQGVGLGLAISRDLARGMGGDLTLESAPGEGSTFTLTLPVSGPTPE